MNRTQHFIAGAWVASAGSSSTDVINATSEEPIASITLGDEVDTDAAVVAARDALAGWGDTSPQKRATFLAELADALEARSGAIASSITDEVGSPIRMSQRIQAALPVTVLRSYVDLLNAPSETEKVGATVIAREPAGVVGAITPWNYPLHQVVAKVAPALAAGCTIVVKPSEVAPLTAYMLAEAASEIGLPPGVLNVVCGTGPVVGRALAEHPGVDALSFTGSVATGAAVASVAAAGIKRLTLELGGKSANVVLDDADLDSAMKVGVSNAFLNGGQTCAAWTRIVVPRSQLAEAVALVERYAAAFQPGDPQDPGTRLGPMASARQRDSVVAAIQGGLDRGVEMLTGGPGRPDGLERGYFVKPTVFVDVDPDDALAQDEIFGPVLVVIGHDGDADAIDIANNSRYGLHGAVWSASPERAMAVARSIRTGSVDINGAAYNPLAPFGGFKQSGVGREMGAFGLADYQEIKAISV